MMDRVLTNSIYNIYMAKMKKYNLIVVEMWGNIYIHMEIEM
jgi:hypothetical protein